MSQKNYYAVQKGFNRGVFETWNECKLQTQGYRFPKFRKFNDKHEALKFAFPERYPLGSILKEEESISDNEPDHKTDYQKSQELQNNYIKFIADLKKREEIVTIPVDFSARCNKIIPCWMDVSKRKRGIIAIYFSPNDKKNYTGLYLWNGVVSSTRMKLYACIKLIEILEQNKETPCNVAVYTKTDYLGKLLNYWTKEWFSRGKDKFWASNEPNSDILIHLCEKCLKNNIKLIPSRLKNDVNEKIVQDMLDEF